MDTIDLNQNRPEIYWRFKESRSQSSSVAWRSKPYCGFGSDAPIIDFYDDGYVTEFASLSNVLEQGPEKVVSEAFAKMSEE